MKRPTANTIAITLAGAAPFTLYWLGGGNFERDPMLAVTAGFSMVFAASAIGLWSDRA